MLQANDRVLHCDRTDFGIQITSAGTDSMDHAAAQTIDDGGHFLDTGSGCAYDTNVARLHHVGKCDRDSGNDSSTTIRSHEEKSLVMGFLFQTDLIFQ